MAQQYQPRQFFRQMPNRFLKQYFLGRNVLTDFNFSQLTAKKIDPLYQAWLELDEDIRSEIEQDFRQIYDLSSDGGSKAILDWARDYGDDLAEQFASLNGIYEHVFWTFLERPQYLRGAFAFHQADKVPASYWRKRKNIPKVSAYVDANSINQLEQKLGDYFYSKQARGKHCKVDCYRRNDLDLFFAYQEDYTQASVEWEKAELTRRPHRPAFELIFSYSQHDGTLDIYLSGDRSIIEDLQAIFAEVILKAELKPNEKDNRIFNLDLLKKRDFQFLYPPESGITEVLINRLRVKIRGTDHVIIVETNPHKNKHATFDLLERATKSFSESHIMITQINITVIFAPAALGKTVKKTFNVTWPNACALKQDEHGLIIRKMLVDSGIDSAKPDKN